MKIEVTQTDIERLKEVEYYLKWAIDIIDQQMQVKMDMDVFRGLSRVEDAKRKLEYIREDFQKLMEEAKQE